MSKVKKKHNKVFIFFSIVFVLGIVALSLYLYFLQKKEKDFEGLRADRKESTDVKGDNEKTYLDYYLIDGVVVQEEFKDLYLKNSDTIGWIKINDTKIDYPVLLNSEDEEYYLHTDFNKEYSYNGSIFAGAGTDIVKPSENILIYGHHIIGGRMFGSLDQYEEEEYYKGHKYIIFNTLRQTGKYEVIAAFRTKVYPDTYEGFQFFRYSNMGQEEYKEYIDNIKELTPYSISTSAAYGDQLISLSTCAYHTSNGRFVIVAKRVDGKEVDLEKEPIEVIETKEE